MRIDRVAARVGLATAVAASTALASAWSLGLSHAYWAALTVFVVAQPTRRLLWSRGVARSIGTVCGAAAAFLLLGWAAAHEMSLVVSLIVWTGLCTGGASLSRGAPSYAALLAGYTACILVFVGLGHPASAYPLASDRLACTMLGIGASMLLSGIFLPGSGAIEQPPQRLSGEAGETSPIFGPNADDEAGVDDTVLPPSLSRLRRAAEAAGRSMIALSIVTAAWLGSGWNGGRQLAMSTAVFVVLFSGHRDPVAATHHALRGALAGAAAAIVIRFVAPPFVVNPLGLLLLIFPILLAGAYAMGRPATDKPAIDFCVTFLLVTQPGSDVPPGLLAAASSAAAIVAGGVVAMLAFRFLYPVRPAGQRAIVKAGIPAPPDAVDRCANRGD